MIMPTSRQAYIWSKKMKGYITIELIMAFIIMGILMRLSTMHYTTHYHNIRELDTYLVKHAH